MQEKFKVLLEEYKMTFGELADLLGISKQTLTKKVTSNMDFTFAEMAKLTEVFGIENPQEFFFN